MNNKNLSRRKFLRYAATGAAALTVPGIFSTCSSTTKKPNIIFLFADDQNFNTLHALGNKEIKTPNLDRLVARSKQFTHAYNMGSWSGAVCMPSRMMLNTGQYLWKCKDAPAEQFPKKLMWSQRIKSAGYKTYMAGKWHVFYNGDWKEKVKPADVFDVVGTLRPGMPKDTPEGYSRPKDEIGSPKNLRDERLAPFPRTEYAVKVNRQEYYAIITHMDKQIGLILDKIDESGQSDNTYIFFTADHGLACGQHGLLGKQNLFDHSVRVPFLVSGPGIKGGTKCTTPIYLQDVMPTSLELAGAEQQGVDFKSLMALIKGKSTQHYNSIYGTYMNLQRMITKDGFKLLYYPEANVYLLFDLKSDPHEISNLADQPEYAVKLEEMKVALLELQKEMNDPMLRQK